MIKNKKIQEAANNFDSGMFMDPEKASKLRSRVHAIQSAMDQAERGAILAEKRGDLETAQALRKRIQELQDLIDGKYAETPDERSGNSGEGTEQGEPQEEGEPEGSEEGGSEEGSSEESNGKEGTSTGEGQEEGEGGSEEGGSGSTGNGKEAGNQNKGKSSRQQNSNGENGESSGEGPENTEHPDRGDTSASKYSGGNNSRQQGASGQSGESGESGGNGGQGGQGSKPGNQNSNNNGESTGNNGTSGDSGEGASSESTQNPFEMNPDQSPSSKGGKLPKQPTIEDIIKILQKLEGDARRGAIAALHDILLSQGINPDDLALTEALKPIPRKSLTDLSDDEFNNIINDVLDEVDRITPLPFIDSQAHKAHIDSIKAGPQNPTTARDIDRESNLNKQHDAAAARAREAEKRKYNNFRALDNFELDLWRTINDQITTHEEEVSSVFDINRYYEMEGDIIVPGTRQEEVFDFDLPSIDLYFDMSSSWKSITRAIEIGQSAVKTLLEFEEDKKLKLNIYYFSDEVCTSIDDPRLGRCTGAWPEIMKKLKAEQPKNVILMTDHDMDDDASKNGTYVADGCVWFIWRDGLVAPEVINHLKGRRGVYQYQFNSQEV